MLRRRQNTANQRKNPLKTGNVNMKTPTKSGLREFLKQRISEKYDLGHLLRVSTWNVQRKGTPEQVDNSISESFSKNELPDIICLQEANLPTSETETNNFKWFCGDTVGSAILVKKLLVTGEERSVEIVKFESVSEQISVLEVNVKNKHPLVIVCSYVPPSTNFLSVDVWDKLSGVLKTVSLNASCIVAGDFNAQIGNGELARVHSKIFGQTLYHDVSDANGAKLKELVFSSHFKLLSTRCRDLDASVAKTNCFTYQKDGAACQQSYILGSPSVNCNVAVDVKRPKDYDHAILQTGIKLYTKEISKKALENNCIVSWNTKGMAPAKVDSILNCYNYPVACVQEVFLTSEQDILTDNYTWHCSKTIWSKNVGIVVQKRDDIVVDKFEALSDFLCVGDLTIKGKPIKVISCYLPKPSHTKHSSVTTQLTDLVKSIPKDTFFILGGDLNYKISTKDSTTAIENNDEFIDNLMKEADLGCHDKLSVRKKKYPFISLMSETVWGSPNQIAIPTSFRVKKNPMLKVMWVPFVEYPIVSVFIQEDYEKEKKEDNEMYKHDERLKKMTTEITTIDGVEHKIRVFDNFEPGEVVKPPPLDSEIVEKYKNTPPDAAELSKLLQDFVIFQDVQESSSQTQCSLTYIIQSFKDARKFGKIVIEEEIKTESSEDPAKPSTKVLRARWNGIVIDEITAESFSRLNSKLGQSIVNKLHQFCYFIKTRKSFFNDGFEPMVEILPKIKDVTRKLVRSSFTNDSSILSFIGEFFTADTNVELVFGPGFSNSFKAILTYAVNHDLKVRFFTTKERRKQTKDDNIAISKRFTPQQIRDRLLKDKEDVRYFLIPPCGLGMDSREFINQYLKEQMKQENKYYSAFWKNDLHPTRQNSGSNQVTPTKNSSKLQQQPKTQNQNNRAKPNSQKQTNSTKAIQPLIANPKKSISAARQLKQQLRRKEFLERVKARSMQREETRELVAGRKRPRDHLERPRDRLERPRDRLERPGYQRDYSNHPSPWQLMYDGPANSDRNRMINDRRDLPRQNDRVQRQDSGYYERDAPRGSWRDTHPRERNPPRNDRWDPPRQNDTNWNDISNSVWNDSDGPNYQSPWQGEQNSRNRGSNLQRGYTDERVKNDRRDVNYEYNYNRNGGNSSLNRSRFDTNSSARNFSSDLVEPPALKRPRTDMFDTEPSVIQLPEWSTVAPLVTVLPITYFSTVEDKPEEILKTNFETNFLQVNPDSVAVIVSLPMRNGIKKDFCLAVGKNHSHAANIAWQVLFRHCTVIKPHQNFLCSGRTPNFVRFKVPCPLTPRTYIILGKDETGPMNDHRAREFISAFKESFNEDLFFDKDGYSTDEKSSIMHQATFLGLKVRHFGDSLNWPDRYVCVYKMKTPEQILEEVLQAGGNHRKYIIMDHN